MKPEAMAKKLKGLQTIHSICTILGVEKRTAANYISILRKAGYLSGTTRGNKKIRLYEISGYTTPPKKGHIGLYDFINNHSNLKLSKPYEHVIYDSEMTAEKAIIESIKTQDFRVILASMPLFRFVSNWPELYSLAKKNNLQKSVGALYDLARKYTKVRRMDNRIRSRLLQFRNPEKYIIPNMRSKNFIEIEKLWKIYLPFNHQDMLRLRKEYDRP